MPQSVDFQCKRSGAESSTSDCSERAGSVLPASEQESLEALNDSDSRNWPLTLTRSVERYGDGTINDHDLTKPVPTRLTYPKLEENSFYEGILHFRLKRDVKAMLRVERTYKCGICVHTNRTKMGDFTAGDDLFYCLPRVDIPGGLLARGKYKIIESFYDASGVRLCADQLWTCHIVKRKKNGKKFEPTPGLRQRISCQATVFST